jgi:predicted P-loop ATPase
LALIAAVRRATDPGAKFDQIIVLESPEGRGKSSAIEILAGKGYFSDQPILTLSDKAQQEAMAGVWLYEIADLAGMARTEVERIKAFASRNVDRARPAYGRARVDKPRTCVFFATTNDWGYLKSQLGNRRFWPIRIGRVDLAGIRRDRDQIWAEAVEAEQQAGSIGLPERLWAAAAEVQEHRVETDPWAGILVEVTGEQDPHEQVWRVSARHILDVVLRIPVERQGMITLKRVANIMEKMGWTRTKYRIGDKIISGYSRPAVTAVTK